jgi:hypothetical protein
VSKLVNTSRIGSLLVLLMAAIVMLSGSVAEGLDLPVRLAEAKRKKKKKRSPAPAFNVVQCQANQEGGDEVYVMRADGSGQKRLTNNGIARDAAPSSRLTADR